MRLFRKLRGSSIYEELDSKYMSIEALEDNLSVSFSKNTIYYSIDNTETWVALPPDTNTPSINKGDRIYFKSDIIADTSGIGTFTINKQCNACGNAMSLTGGDPQFKNLFKNCTTLIRVSKEFLPETNLKSSCYNAMFYGCTSLIEAPELPAVTVPPYGYQEMFKGCTSLITTPQLPATTIDQYSYYGMFQDCTSLVETPNVLPAMTLQYCCYAKMFSGCTSLVIAPELPAEVLTSNCYDSMFVNCSSLTYICAKFTDVPYSSCTLGWVKGVSASGIFVKNYNTSDSEVSYAGISESWTIMEYPDVVNMLQCDSLSIIRALDVMGSETNTTVEYSATGLGHNTITGHTYKMSITGLGVSDPFEQNVSTTDSIVKTITFTLANLTKSIDIAHRPWVDSDRTYVYVEALEDGLTLKFPKKLKYWTEEQPKPKILNKNIESPPINKGQRIYIQGQMLDGYNGSYGNGMGTFTFNKKCKVGGNALTLVTSTNTTLELYHFYYLFKECTTLVGVSKNFLPSTTTTQRCYSYMFYKCSSLTEVPDLPALTLSSSCYSSMFGGCSSLITAPKLPATTLASSCYEYMFTDCVSLIEAPDLPSQDLVSSCYSYMFSGCSSLIKTPKLPAITLANYCYRGMFEDCISIIEAPELLANTLISKCYANMFSGCTQLQYIYAKFTTTPSSSYTENWMQGVSPTGTFIKNVEASWNVVGVYGIPENWEVKTNDTCAQVTNATSLVINKAYDVIGNETTTVVEYTATGTGLNFIGEAVEGTITGIGISNTFEHNNSSEAVEKSISFTFGGLTQSTTITHYPYMDLEKACMYVEALEDGLVVQCSKKIKYLIPDQQQWLFDYKTSSINTGQRVYIQGMCYDDTTNIGKLVLTKKCKVGGNLKALVNIFNNTIKPYQFQGLFKNCFNLVEIDPNFLYITDLAEGCYANMFENCTNLTTPPELPATTLADSCYESMFYGCVSLTSSPKLPALTLCNNCYKKMFFNCTSLVEIAELSATTMADYCCSYMFYKCISLTNMPELPAMTLAKGCYDNMFQSCTSLSITKNLPATTLAESCYAYMFDRCTNLKKGPDLLPALVLHNNCYQGMFNQCSSLIQSPEIAATTVAKLCCENMFYYCTSLIKGPSVLHATTLDSQCYDGMFYHCTSLTTPPELPATQLSDSCYHEMFFWCTSLTQAPELPATTLAANCYDSMFQGCSSLTQAPELPAMTLAKSCYENMFYNCTSLVKAPDLNAIDLVSSCYTCMFYNCASLNYVVALFITDPSSSTSSWLYRTSSTGTFIKNLQATWDNSKVIPTNWEVKTNLTIEDYIDLSITADNTSGRSKTTKVYYTLTCKARNLQDELIDTVLTGTGISNPFEQNTSTTDSVERTVTFTLGDLTASTTITQGTWEEKNYTINLNNEWQLNASYNPNSSLYEGMYESFSNKGVNKSTATMTVRIVGYTKFQIYIRSYAESSYDYVLISNLDQPITYDTSYSSVKANTRSNQQSGSTISSYTLVEYNDIDDQEHIITIVYRKDGVGSKGKDQGFVLIPKEQ